MTYKLLIFCCFFMGAYFCPGIKIQGTETESQTVIYKPNGDSKIRVRKISRVALHEYSKDADFNYKETTINDSWWDRMWKSFWHFIENLFGSKKNSAASPSGATVKYIMMGLLIGFIIWGVVKLAGISSVFTRESKQVNILYTESLENIHKISFSTEIESAVNQRNYRLAVRLLYLQSLKMLNDHRLINWQIEKTNSMYINEIKDTSQRQSFNILTRHFEYIWYGEFPIEVESFKHINDLFVDFKATLL